VKIVIFDNYLHKVFFYLRQVSLNPLYLFSNFFKGKAIEYLIDKGAKTEYLNGDKLGLVLDKLYHKVLNYQDLRKDTI
jgi:hypothetical protein